MIASEKIEIDLEKIIGALLRSTLIAELRDHEIEILIDMLAIQSYKAGEFIARPGDCPLGDALLILVEGKVEVSAMDGFSARYADTDRGRKLWQSDPALTQSCLEFTDCRRWRLGIGAAAADDDLGERA